LAVVELRAAALRGRLGGDRRGSVAFSIATRDEATADQGVEPLTVCLGLDVLGVGGMDRGLGGADVGRGQLLLGVQRDQGGPSRLDGGLRVPKVGVGRSHAGVELFGIDADQGIAAPDRLVVRDQHLGDQTAHLGCDGRTVGLHIGRVGRDGGLGRGQIDPAPHGQNDRSADHQGGAGRERRAPFDLADRWRGRRRDHADRRFGQGGGAHRSNTSRVEVAVA
jgi:hypothetical protein